MPQPAINPTPRKSAQAAMGAVQPVAGMFGSLALMGATMPFGMNVEIYGEEEPADFVYQDLTGAVRTYRVLSDGRRQVTAFYLPGDVFGLEFTEAHTSSAEAISRSTVRIVKRSAVMAIAQRSSEVARSLWLAAALELQRSEQHSLMLIKGASERVVAFLLEIADRLQSARTVELPMSRQDMADYLGLTIETVSRSLSQLASEATIEMPTKRRIELRNPSVLKRLNA